MRASWPDTGKRRVRRKIFPILLFFLVFPTITVLLTGREPVGYEESAYDSEALVEVQRFWGKERLPLEEYLIGMLAATIPLEYNEEVLKAQSILLRSWCLSLAKWENGYSVIPEEKLRNRYLSPEDFRLAWPEDYEEKQEQLQTILKETEGMVLLKGGQIVAPPFFRVSNGKTRKVEEYQAYASAWDYIQVLECPEDVMAEEYLGKVELEEKEFTKKLAQLFDLEAGEGEKIRLHRDSSDYVMHVEVAGKKITGEEFRKEFNLPSACFFLQQQEDHILIKTRGVGHGFGFCQYYANQLAGSGQTYTQLLETFFVGLKTEKI